MTQFKKMALGVAVGMALVSGSVFAASVDNTLFPGFQRLSDNSAESLIDMNGSAAGIVDIGDRLRGIFRIESTTSSQGLGDRDFHPVNNQLAGVFDLTVADKACGVGGCIFSFRPTSLGVSGFDAWGAVDGTAVMFFESAAAPFFADQPPGCNVIGPGGDCEAGVTNPAGPGSVYWYAGFLGGSNPAFLDLGELSGVNALTPEGDFWWARADTDNIGISEIIDPLTSFGAFNLGVHILPGGVGKALGDVSCSYTPGFVTGLQVNFCGNGQLLSKGPAGASGSIPSPYDSLNDVNFNINVIPEPGSLALLGLGLGIGALVLRRRRA